MARLDVSRSTKGTIDYLYCIPADDREKQLLVSVVGARPQEKTGQVRFNPDVFLVRDLQRLLGEHLHVTPQVETWLAGVLTEHTAILQTARVPDITLPLAISPRLRNYQRIGAKWLAERKRGILGDSMGLGKSACSLTATYLIGAKRVLVVTLSIAKWQWQGEIEQWFGEGSQTVIVDGTAAQRKALLQQEAKYVIIHYDLLRDALAKPATKTRNATPAKYPELLKTKWDVVIFDEAHKLQSPKSQQSKAAAAVAARTPYVFELTGTPIWNMPDSLWHLLHILDPSVLSSYWAYVAKYCTVEETVWGDKVTGVKPAMLPELKERLSHYLLQRHKEDVAPELPAKVYTTITYDLSPQQQKEYRRIKEELRIAYAEGDRHFANVVSAAVALRKLCNDPHTLGLDHDSPKDAVVLELVENMLAQKDKIAILCWHKDYADHLKVLLEERRIGCTLATGAEVAAKRIVRVGQFRTSPDRVLIGTIASMGTALNLGYITDVVFVERDWIPPPNSQAEDRFHRLTSTSTVNIYTVLGRGTIEQHIYEVGQRVGLITDEVLAIQHVVQAVLAEP